MKREVSGLILGCQSMRVRLEGGSDDSEGSESSVDCGFGAYLGGIKCVCSRSRLAILSYFFVEAHESGVLPH